MGFYLVRHAMSFGNLEDNYSTDRHHLLCPNGKQQARRLVGRLKALSFHALYVSPQLRAMDTVLPFLRATGRKAVILPELTEGCSPSTRRVTPPPRPAPVNPIRLAPAHQPYFELDRSDAAHVPEDETYEEGRARFRQLRDLLVTRHNGSDESILVISHGFALSWLIAHLLDADDAVLFHHDNTGMTHVFSLPDGRRVLEYGNRL